MDIAARHSLGRNSAHNVMRRMHDLRLIHVSRWDYPERGPCVAVWKLGEGVDAPRPACKTTGAQSLKTFNRPPCRPSLETAAFARLIRSLSEPQTIASLSEVSGGGPGQVGRFIRIAHSIGLVYLADWDRRLQGGSPGAMWELGIDEQDAPRPKRMSRLIVERRYRAGRRAKAMTLMVTHALASNVSPFTQAA
jgi:hypothetical protein